MKLFNFWRAASAAPLAPQLLPALDLAQRATLPTGVVVPDLTAKRSLVLQDFNTKRQADRVRKVQADRYQQQARSYEGANVSRLTSEWAPMHTSADSELLTSLRLMRARSRQLVRDNPYAKHAVRLIVNNVVGSGIGMQAQVKSGSGKLLTPVNDAIEQAYGKWSDKRTCHTGGEMSFQDIERWCVAQLVTAGEALIRKHRMPFGGGKVPLALEVIESDRLMDQWQSARAPNGNAIRLGKEVDEWGRCIAYWFWPRHPGDYQFATFDPSKFLRVPADEVIHLYLVDRWPQTRGEPWFHSVLSSLHQQHGYEEAEVVKARASANVVGFIRSPEPLTPDEIKGGRQLLDTEPGTWQRLLPGEDVAGFAPSSPNPGLEPFLRYMVRKMATGVGISYESLSRDYSAATYSSARMALLDDRDLYRMLQGWLIRNLRADIHREWLDAAVLVGAVPRIGTDYFSNADKYQAVRFKPRGWSWIDPSKEVAAYKMAVRCGFMAPEDVIAQTANGADIEDIYKTWAENRDLAESLELVFDTDAAQVNDKGQVQPAPVDSDAPGSTPEPGEQPQPGAGAGAEPAGKDEPPEAPAEQA